jgi:hypothetical protein
MESDGRVESRRQFHESQPAISIYDPKVAGDKRGAVARDF